MPAVPGCVVPAQVNSVLQVSGKTTDGQLLSLGNGINYYQFKAWAGGGGGGRGSSPDGGTGGAGGFVSGFYTVDPDNNIPVTFFVGSGGSAASTGDNGGGGGTWTGVFPGDLSAMKASCRVATTANLSATYDNGSSGVGATLTNNSTKAAIKIDGVTLVLNDRILVKNQTNKARNGIYKVTTVGNTTVNWVITRTTDFDSNAEIDYGSSTYVVEGDTNATDYFYCTTQSNVTVGTTDIDFDLGAPFFVAGAGGGGGGALNTAGGAGGGGGGITVAYNGDAGSGSGAGGGGGGATFKAGGSAGTSSATVGLVGSKWSGGNGNPPSGSGGGTNGFATETGEDVGNGGETSSGSGKAFGGGGGAGWYGGGSGGSGTGSGGQGAGGGGGGTSYVNSTFINSLTDNVTSGQTGSTTAPENTDPNYGDNAAKGGAGGDSANDGGDGRLVILY
jgi:hypothetical protein